MAGLFIVLSLSMALAASGDTASGTYKVMISEQAARAHGVATVTAEPAEQAQIEAIGMVDAAPDAVAAVATPFAGVVTELLTAPGKPIKTGEPILALESSAYPAAVAELEAATLMAEHRASLAERSDKLLKLGLVSLAQAEEAHHDAEEASQRREALRRQLRQTKRGSGARQVILLAPHAGVVTAFPFVPGQAVAADDAVALIAKNNRRLVKVPVPASTLAEIPIGSDAELGENLLVGHVEAVSPVVGGETRSREVWISLPEESSSPVGSLIKVRIAIPAPDAAMKVPARAVTRIDGRPSIFIRSDDGFDVKPVHIVARNADTVVISGDIPAGAQVAASGTAALKNLAERS
ncbi:efflux RND transporter periplasmic adaptor subunit [Parvularcula lutaonensis]|uniref:Efflux RND transporter periplasmic adaptor subunit n=1 Tax=Parvularcula lutaonensis TaxID=491923 RepID=A0ABV7MCR2_9PROT|nr:efflux RND transporter periplasmic adaptor subunit [Parvularcula lutaonensis]GGY37752.1 hypothetical protein GCM10007148_02530 [Parvularcula lutaonensis]